MEIEVRFATFGDIGALVDTQQEWLKIRKSLGYESQVKPITPEFFASHINGKYEVGKYLIATSPKGKALGSCFLNLTFIDLGGLEIGDLIVKEIYRQKGVGTALVRKAIDFAKESDIYQIQVWSIDDFKDARKLYEKMGLDLIKGTGVSFYGREGLLYRMSLPKTDSLSR